MSDRDSDTFERTRFFATRTFTPLSLARAQRVLADRYAVERELGAGGASIVYHAFDHERGHAVAIKVLRPELSAALVAARFLREIAIGSQLSHPNVLSILDHGVADGELYYTMPVVDGETLRHRLMRKTPLALSDILRIGCGVANALDHAHGLGFIHRDITPANILLDNERVIVADFGLSRAITVAATSRLTKSGQVLGTAHYMSPEQSRGERTLDSRTDVYSFACVVYEMVAGEPVFAGATIQAILSKHQRLLPRSLRTLRPTLPPNAQRVIEQALAKSPSDRFASAGAFVSALEGAINGS